MTTLTALITGATSGIGSACAEAFAQAGYNLMLWARRTERLEELKQQLQTTSNSIEIFSVDVQDHQQVKNAFAAIPTQLRNISVLINNAGLSRGLSPLHEGAVQDWEEMIDTNLKGLLYVTREILPGMVERGFGTVINIASVAGRQPYRGGNVYGATKAAVKMLSDSLQIDLNGTGVRVCNLDPGMVETEFSIVRFRGDQDRAKTVYHGTTPLLSSDVADTALWVASRPPHVNVQDILLMPTSQASVSVVHRKNS